KNLLRGFPSRVYPVGNLEYAASGVVFMTNDGDLAAALLKKWNELEQTFYVKVKGMLTLADLERFGKEAGVKLKTLRQPGASRGLRGDRKSSGGNFWYEVKMRGSKMEALRNVLFRERHPLKKVKRVALGPLTVDGIPQGRYRMIEKKDADGLIGASRPK